MIIYRNPKTFFCLVRVNQTNQPGFDSSVDNEHLQEKKPYLFISCQLLQEEQKKTHMHNSTVFIPISRCLLPRFFSLILLLSNI